MYLTHTLFLSKLAGSICYNIFLPRKYSLYLDLSLHVTLLRGKMLVQSFHNNLSTSGVQVIKVSQKNAYPKEK